MYRVGPTLGFQFLKTQDWSCPWVVVLKTWGWSYPWVWVPKDTFYDLSLGGSRIYIIYDRVSFRALIVDIYIGGD